MICRFTLMVALGAIAAFCPLVTAQDESPRPDTSDKPVITSLEFRINPLMDLMMAVRAWAEDENATPPEIQGMREAVEAARGIGAELGGSGWGIFTGPCSTATTAAEMRAIAQQLPEQFNRRSDGELNLRDISTRLADALAAAEDAFLTELWPERKLILEQRRDELARILGPKQDEIYAYVQDKLAVTDPQPVVPVYLVNECPWPGAMTYRSRAGGMCFVGSDAGEGSQLLETVIHESLHALDVTSSTPDIFDQLRTKLMKAGVERTDARIRDIPHMLMFVHAAETVRRLLVPDHVDYGELEMFGRPGLYARDKASVDAVRPAWRAYLDGEIDREEALRRIVELATVDGR